MEQFDSIFGSVMDTTLGLRCKLCGYQYSEIIVLVEQQKTGQWLAEQLGKSTCTISKWCSNTVQPDLNTLDKIAKLLNLSVKDLLNETKK